MDRRIAMRLWSRAVPIVALVALGGWGAGCGDDDSDEASTEPTEAADSLDGSGSDDTESDDTSTSPADCPLTEEQVSAVLEIEVTGGSSGCAFQSTSSTFAEVYFAYVPTEVFGADEPTAVEGVGDEAYLGPSDELYVLDGDVGFSIQVLLATSLDDPDPGGAAQLELAQLVIEGSG